VASSPWQTTSVPGTTRGGRLSLNSVSVPLDGFQTNPFHRLPVRGMA
jgi:hypothetical protein